MSTFAFSGHALSIGAAAALLAGCGQSQVALSPPAGPRALAQRFVRATGEVQYFSNYYSATLVEFDYPKSESQIGSISFSGGGECTKGARTFWVTGGEIAEFKVGGATPIRVLKASAGACAIDPTTGDLAALTYGGVVIFHKARGKGKFIAGSGIGYFDGYDNNGNLFADGLDASYKFMLIELPKGSSKFQTITPSNTVQFPGSVQWDGKYLTVFDQLADAFYQYTVSGTQATLEGTVLLSGATDCIGTWIARPYVYCADAGNDDGEVFNYPAGGKAIAVLQGTFDEPLGVVSLRVR
jgi:hypothetical protein